MTTKDYLKDFDNLGLSSFEEQRADLADGSEFKYDAKFIDGVAPDVNYVKDLSYTDKNGDVKSFNLASISMVLTDIETKESRIGSVNAASPAMRSVLKSNNFSNTFGVVGIGKESNAGNLSERREVRLTPFSAPQTKPAEKTT